MLGGTVGVAVIVLVTVAFEDPGNVSFVMLTQYIYPSKEVSNSETGKSRTVCRKMTIRLEAVRTGRLR